MSMNNVKNHNRKFVFKSKQTDEVMESKNNFERKKVELKRKVVLKCFSFILVRTVILKRAKPF